MREQRAAMEKELASMQAKAQGSYQELQAMQIKVRPLISCSLMEINILEFFCFFSQLFPNQAVSSQNVAWRPNLVVLFSFSRPESSWKAKSLDCSRRTGS